MLNHVLLPLGDLSRRFLGVNKRQQIVVIAGPACYAVCNQAGVVYQSVGPVPQLCDPTGDFALALDQVEACVEAEVSGSGVSSTISELDDALNYCAGIGSGLWNGNANVAPSTTTTPTSVAPTTKPATPQTTSAVVVSTSTTVPSSTSALAPTSTTASVTSAQVPTSSVISNTPSSSSSSSSFPSSSSPPSSAPHSTIVSSQAISPTQSSSKVPLSTAPTTFKTSSTSALTSSSTTSILSPSPSMTSASSSSSSSPATAANVAANSSSPTSSNSPQHSISTGEVVGIAVGAAAIGILIFALVVFFVMRYRRKKRNAGTPDVDRRSGPVAAAVIKAQQEEEKAQLHGDDYRAELSPEGKPISRIRTVGGLEELEWDPAVMQRRADHEERAELTGTGSPPPQYATWSDSSNKEVREY